MEASESREIDNKLQEAINNCRQAAIAGVVSIVLTTALVAFSIWQKGGSKTLNYFADPSIFVDIVIMIVFVIMTFMRSRIGSVLLFVHYLGGQILTRIATGNYSGFILTGILLFFMGKGVIGAFEYVRLRRQLDSSFRKRGIILNTLIFVGLVGYGAVIALGGWLVLTGQA
ncbi:MAG: hypothetical protein AAFW83_11680 [Pseudomonadota bacterium]